MNTSTIKLSHNRHLCVPLPAYILATCLCTVDRCVNFTINGTAQVNQQMINKEDKVGKEFDWWYTVRSVDYTSVRVLIISNEEVYVVVAQNVLLT